MEVKLYLDENIPPILAQQLRRRGFDTISAYEVNMLGKTDEEQLAYATRNERAILTFDTDFIPLAFKLLSDDKHHSGIILSKEMKRQQIGELMKLCSRFLSQVQPEEIGDGIFFLQAFKS